ncbi:hypothetical protein ACJMK2_025643 [Sinanodonta woodiana]|uniref:RING-type domain-containing protein n=1 Tax=Sinanodonta woodiana TaxID=1069815 RepID=A0ABD3XKL7_SINWO
MDPLPKIYEIQLSLMVAPNKTCKPVIEQIGNSLKASLKANDCGKPVAVPYWKDYASDLNTNESILMLNPEMEAREYNACIKGASLACVNKTMLNDYCTTFKTQGIKSPPASLETSKTYALIAGCITLGILLLLTMLLLAVLFIRYRRMKLLVKSQKSKSVESIVLWREQSKDNPQSKLKTQCDLGIDKEATTEEHSCNEPDKLRELIKLRDEIRCKICTVNIMSVCFVPCKHIVTCSTCSCSLQKCPLCRVLIEGKLAVNFE